MVDIPSKIQIRSTIKPGSVYYFPEETFSSPDAHYFIVLNTKPLTDTILILVWARSNISKVRKRRHMCPEETLIKITPRQYSGFSKKSIIDCNRVIEKTIEQLVEKLSEGKLRMKPEMDIALVNRLKKGVMRSTLIEQRIKIML